MIYVRIELWPFGRQKHAQLLGECRISNEGGLASDTYGNYRYDLTGKSDYDLGSGIIEKFPRKRLLAWDLLARVLDHAR